MSTRRKRPRSRRGRTQDGTYPDYPSIQSQSPEALWSRLVEDGVRRIPTPLTWLVAAVAKIAHAKRTTKDRVFSDLDATVKERCGMGLSREPGCL